MYKFKKEDKVLVISGKYIGMIGKVFKCEEGYFKNQNKYRVMLEVGDTKLMTFVSFEEKELKRV